MVDKFVFIGN